MKIHDCEQGSPDWYALRSGCATASCFEKIVTPTGQLSKQANKYAYRLIAETLLKRPMDSIEGLEWMERGKMLEPEAAKIYEFEQEVETVKVGFITSDDGLIGASPDRLVGSEGLLEIKCPAPQTHVMYMVEGLGNDYRPQVQGQLMVAEREWSDLFSYNEEMPPVRIRTVRDEDYITLLRTSLNAFNEMKAEMLERIRKQGFFAERERISTIVDEAYKNTA